MSKNPQLIQLNSEVAFAQSDGDATAVRTFTTIAYTGGANRPKGWRHPVVIDIEGVELIKPQVPIRYAHNELVGHSTNVTMAQKEIAIEGLLSVPGPDRDRIIEAADNGFEWQQSIAGQPTEVEFLEQGHSAKVNGEIFSGPKHIIRRLLLKESSFLALGADTNTSANVPPIAASFDEGEWQMPTEPNNDNVEQPTDTNTGTGGIEQGGGTQDPKPGTVEQTPEPNPDVSELRLQMAADRKAMLEIHKACAKHPDIEITALEQDWSLDRTMLEVSKTDLAQMREDRNSGPAIHNGSMKPELQQDAIVAALCLQQGMASEIVEAEFSDEIMQAAHRPENRRMSLHGLMYQTIQMAGGHVSYGHMDNATIRQTFEASNKLEQAGVTTYSMPGIIGAVANKSLLAAFQSQESALMKFAHIGSVDNFHTHTRYTLTDDGSYALVGRNGELSGMTLGEESWTNEAKTRGAIIGLSRTDIINDDLSAFIQIPTMLGINARDALEQVGITALSDNDSSFFQASNGNYISGGTTTLTAIGLALAEVALLNQTKPNGNPMAVTGKYLLVPPALDVAARELFTSTNIVAGGGSSTDREPDKNIFAGKYIPIVSPWLSNSILSNNSSTGWYLLSDQAIRAVLEVVFLRGVQSPTIESADLDFGTLGIQYRSFFDFGVSLAEKRMGVFSEGA